MNAATGTVSSPWRERLDALRLWFQARMQAPSPSSSSRAHSRCRLVAAHAARGNPTDGEGCGTDVTATDIGDAKLASLLMKAAGPNSTIQSVRQTHPTGTVR
jgi:hypothetical protein